MAAAVDCLDALQRGYLRQYQLHEAAFLHEFESHGGGGREHYLVELHHDALGGDYLYPFGVAPYGLEGVVGYAEAELAGEADGAHHAQGVVAEGDVGVEGSAQDAGLEVGDTIEGVHQLSVAVAIEAHG